MKKVVDSRQVAHLWANKSQDEARNSGGNLYFNGPAIYSYGSHFVIAAHLDNGDVVINDESRSNTTSKQQCYVRNALSAGQWQKVIHVPHLNDTQWRELDRCTRNPDGKTAPSIIASMARIVEDIIMGMAGRRTSGKLAGEWASAKHLEQNALRILALCAKGKRTPAWPLALLPDEMPDDKEARESWIKSMVRAKLVLQYQESIANAKLKGEKLAEELDKGNDDFEHRWQINNIKSIVDSLRRNLADADKTYGTLHDGKKSSVVRTLTKRLDIMEPNLRKLVTDWAGAHAQHEMRTQIRLAFKELRALKKATPYRANVARHIASKMAGLYGQLCAAGLPTDHALPIMRRMERTADWFTCAESLKAAKQSLADVPSYLPKFSNDALICLKTATRHALNANISNAFMMSPYGAEREKVLAEINQLRKPIEKDIADKFATRVADWQAGLVDYLDHDAGTYARIEGKEVVTSRGARVPIVHACRLARIARRVIASGGKYWANNDGPIVGGFRVNAIRADGSATIGCHEFDAAESMRLLAVLESCADCQHAHETVEA